MINKLRALVAWYSKGLDNGSHLRTAINAATSVPQTLEIIDEFFQSSAGEPLLQNAGQGEY